MKPINIMNKLNESAWSEEDFEYIKDKTGTSDKAESGGIIRFDHCPIENLIDLVEKGYADPSDAQNSGRSIKERIDFYKNNDTRNFEVGGYVVVPRREDYRVSVDEVEFDANDELKDLVDEFAEYADDYSFDNGHAYMWWD